METLVIVMQLDVPTYGDVIYPSGVISDAISVFQERLDANNGVILGESGPPPIYDWTPNDRHQTIDLSRASHMVKSLWIDGSILKAKIGLMGRYRELAEAGWEPSVIPRAFGTIGEDGICSKYTLITLDLTYHELGS